MRNGRRYRTIGIMLVLAMVCMSACTTFDSFKNTFIDKDSESTDNVIRIGVFEPQTGRYSDTGNSEIKGIELANSIYNSVNGYQVELVKVDTQSTSTAAETAIQGLIKMNPVAIIGSCGEATSLIASEYVEDAEIPTITPSATNPLITQNCKYYFRASMTGDQMGSGIAEYAYKELGSRHIGIITSANDTAATAILKGFNKKINAFVKAKKEAAEETTDNSAYAAAQASENDSKDSYEPVVLNEEIDIEETDINKLVKKIKKKSVDTIFIPLGTETMDTVFTAIEKAGLTDIQFIGTKAWGNEDFIKMMENHPDIKIAFPYQAVLGNSDSITEETERFKIEYANKYGSDDIPTENAALGYDSYLLLINAIHNAKSLDGADIKTALLELKDVKCSTGSFTFDKNGNTVRPVNISTIKDGKVVAVYQTEDTTKTEEIEGLD